VTEVEEVVNEMEEVDAEEVDGEEVDGEEVEEEAVIRRRLRSPDSVCEGSSRRIRSTPFSSPLECESLLRSKR
jgi:hypothetical protein